ncbi:unnamed protein product [Adineta steineri]|uniref:Purinergic receptor n=1 Tax=Adineta steineri TaxID=433720 RepID=A0A815T348_9BILA|nr:unnamed protein product [Adineta steineri]
MVTGIIAYRFPSRVLGFFFNYSSVREIEVRNTFVALVHRILQFTVLAYIFLYIVWIRKGYQRFQEPRGSSVIKVKGIGRVNISNPHVYPENKVQALWDASEFGIPPIEENAFFIATRKIITYDQTVGICPSALLEKVFCNATHNTCKQGTISNNTLGFQTGNCVPSLEDKTILVCEIEAWCPEEGANSTGTVKNGTDFLCRFRSKTARQCPIFQIGYILQKLKEQDPRINLSALYHQGGLIEIRQNWNCNFDSYKDRTDCFPVYDFDLLQKGDDKLSPGINYRFADKYRMNGIEYRTLTKMFGLRFVLTITGEAGKFDFYFLFLAVGSGISCMVIADFVCEFIFKYIHKNNEQYSQSKISICDLVQDVNIASTKL